jgi:hypothetical protein
MKTLIILSMLSLIGCNDLMLTPEQPEKYFQNDNGKVDITGEWKSAYFHGCQTYLKEHKNLPKLNTPILLKRSCFMCEDTLKAQPIDITKTIYKAFTKPNNNYNVVYGNGKLEKGWI